MAQKIKKLSKKFIALVCMFTLVFSYSVVGVNESDAGVLTSISDTLSDSRPSTVSDHTITFTTVLDVVANDTMVITFDTAFDTSTIVFGDIDLKWGATEVTLAGTCGVTTDTTAIMAADVLTFTLCSTATTFTAGSVIEIQIGKNATTGVGGTNQITNPALLGCTGSSSVCDISVSGTGTFLDTGTMQVAILTGVSVSATIDQYMTFSASDTAIGFGSWSAGSTAIHWANSNPATTSTADPGAGNPLALTYTSNVTGGSITVKSSNGEATPAARLYSSGASAGIIAQANGSFGVTAGVAGFSIHGTSATMTMHDDFDNDSTDGELLITNKTFATASAVGANTVEVDMLAAIAASTPAGTYTTTIVFVGTPTY